MIKFSPIEKTWMLVLVLCSCKPPGQEKKEETDSSSGTAGMSTTGGADTGTSTGVDCSVNPGGWSCDPWCQDCSKGQKCVPLSSPYSLPTASCDPVLPNPKQVGEPCDDEGEDDCDKGLVCLGVNAELRARVCAPLCLGTPQEPICKTDGERCFLSANDVLGVCFPVCDPLAQDCPFTSEQCSLNDPDCDDAACLPLSRRGTFHCNLDLGSTSSYGSPCLKQFSCAAGQACVASEQVVACADAVGCCTPYCDPNDPEFLCPDSDKGMKCLPVFTADTEPKDVHVGVCRLP